MLSFVFLISRNKTVAMEINEHIIKPFEKYPLCTKFNRKNKLEILKIKKIIKVKEKE